MRRFDDCFAVVVGEEGGYVNHPNDRGGATKYGVADAADGKKDGLVDLDGDGTGDVPVPQLTLAQAKEKYRSEYWLPLRADALPPPLDLVVFDAAINHGVRRAVKLLQRTAAVLEDGILGHVTMRAVQDDVNVHGAQMVALTFLGVRAQFYVNIVANDPSQAVFAAGWTNRIKHMESLVRSYS